MASEETDLHITNGHVFQERLRSLELGGKPMPWMDVLHEGPVPANLSLRELTPLRAHHISLQGWGSFYAVLAGLQKRDRILLEELKKPGEITLWFEEDLYDQLQLMQILTEICRASVPTPTISLVQTPKNLMQYEDNELHRLYAFREVVTSEMYADAQTAWEAFTAQSPERLNELRQSPFHHLPLLNAAMARLMEEFPSSKNGLTKVENWILQLLAHGFDTSGAIFSEYQKLEDSPYLGDITFLSYVARLSDTQFPIVESVIPEEEENGEIPPPNLWQRKLKLTLYGELVLHNEMNLLEMRSIDRWIGGVHIQERDTTWVWNPETRQIEKLQV